MGATFSDENLYYQLQFIGHNNTHDKYRLKRGDVIYYENEDDVLLIKSNTTLATNIKDYVDKDIVVNVNTDLRSCMLYPMDLTIVDVTPSTLTFIVESILEYQLEDYIRLIPRDMYDFNIITKSNKYKVGKQYTTGNLNWLGHTIMVIGNPN